MLGGAFGDDLADFGGAGEVDAPRQRVIDERVDYFGASALEWVMTLSTPGGKPPSTMQSPISRCSAGHFSEAFSTTVLPQASGMAKARTARMIGAFQGAMPTSTPTGWR